MLRVHNKLADVLANLASKADVLDKIVDLRVMKRILQAFEVDLVFTDSWMSNIGKVLFQNLNQPFYNCDYIFERFCFC